MSTHGIWKTSDVRKMSNIKYLVGYADCECFQILEIFESKKLAEAYLKPYYDLKAKYQKGEDDYDFIFGFYPSIQEITIKDSIDEELIFVRTVCRHNGKVIENIMELYHAMGIESDADEYRTFTLDEEEALKEAEEHFAKYSDEDVDEEE